MTRLVPVTALLAVWLSTGAAAQAPPAATAPKPTAAGPDRTATERALVANERKLYEAVVNGDKATFSSLVSSDGVAADSSGFVPTKMFASVLDQIKVTKWDIVNPQVIWIDPTSAVVAYTGPARERFRGNRFLPRRSRRRCGPGKAGSGWRSTTRKPARPGREGLADAAAPASADRSGAVRRSRSHQTRQIGCFTIFAFA